MKCRDESKLMNYQEPHNYLYGSIKFSNQCKSLSSFLLLCFYEAQEGNRKAHHLKNFSLRHLWSLLIYILFGGKKNKGGVAGLFLIFRSTACVREGPEALLFHCPLLCPSVLLHSSYKNHLPLLLWLSLNLLSLANTQAAWKWKKMESFQEIVHNAESSEKIPWDGFLRVLKISVC